MTRSAIYVLICIATAALLFGLIKQSYPMPAAGFALLGVVWMIAYRYKIDWIAEPGLILYVVSAAIGIWAGIPLWTALVCVMSALGAWDLTLFVQRLEMTSDRSDRHKMERVHFRQLGIVSGASLAGVIAIPFIRINLTFGGAVFLAFLGIWGISVLVHRLRRQEDEIDA